MPGDDELSVRIDKLEPVGPWQPRQRGPFARAIRPLLAKAGYVSDANKFRVLGGNTIVLLGLVGVLLVLIIATIAIAFSLGPAILIPGAFEVALAGFFVWTLTWGNCVVIENTQVIVRTSIRSLTFPLDSIQRAEARERARGLSPLLRSTSFAVTEAGAALRFWTPEGWLVGMPLKRNAGNSTSCSTR